MLIEDHEAVCVGATIHLNVNKSLTLDNFNTAELKDVVFKLGHFWTYINTTLPVYRGTEFYFVVVFDLSSKYEKLFTKRLYHMVMEYGLFMSEEYMVGSKR